MTLIFNNILLRFVYKYVVLYFPLLLKCFEIEMVTIGWRTECEIEFKHFDPFLGIKIHVNRFVFSRFTLLILLIIHWEFNFGAI